MSCRLWKADDNKINSICRFKGQAQSGKYYLNDASFTYNNNYNIIIIVVHLKLYNMILAYLIYMHQNKLLIIIMIKMNLN